MKRILFILVILFPTIAYATNPHVVNNNNVQQVRVVQRRVEFSPEYFLGTEGYYAYGQQLKANKQAVTDDTLVNELKEQNKILKDIVAALTGKKVEVPPTESTPSPANNVPEPNDGYSQLEKAVYNIFSESCVKCHGDTKADGGLALIKNGKLQDLSVATSMILHHRTNGIGLDVDNGEVRMPKGSPPLDNDKVETIRLWSVEKAYKELDTKGK